MLLLGLRGFNPDPSMVEEEAMILGLCLSDNSSRLLVAGVQQILVWCSLKVFLRGIRRFIVSWAKSFAVSILFDWVWASKPISCMLLRFAFQFFFFF